MKIKLNSQKTSSVKTQRPGKVSFGSSTSFKPSPLTPKKTYKKAGSDGGTFGQISFGQTGLTGES